jgi:hypothetical protein
MTVRVTYMPSGIDERLRGIADRLTDLGPAAQEAAPAVVEQNARANFDPTHRLSHFVVRKERIEIGSRSRAYARLLSIDGAEIARIYRAHILGGR